jgi:hypothetical protein
MGSIISTDSVLGRRSIDVLLELYVAWREECNAVQQAYQRWAGSDRGEGGLAYAWYVAALDGEERAARAYAHQIDTIERSAR